MGKLSLPFSVVLISIVQLAGMICAINTAAREPTGGNDEHKLCNSESPDDCIAPGILTPDTNGRFELPGGLMPPERKEHSTTPIHDMLPEGIRDSNSANQEVMESGDMHVMGPNDRLCYDARCNGHGCLYNLLLGLADRMSHSCIAVFPDVCYSSYQTDSDPVNTVEEAGCGIDCPVYISTTAVVSSNESTIKPTTIFMEPISVTDRSTVKEPANIRPVTGPTTRFFLEPRRRRKRSSGIPDRQCCYANHCNHGSPCGQLHCSGEAAMARKTLLLALLGYLYHINS